MGWIQFRRRVEDKIETETRTSEWGSREGARGWNWGRDWGVAGTWMKTVCCVEDSAGGRSDALIQRCCTRASGVCGAAREGSVGIGFLCAGCWWHLQCRRARRGGEIRCKRWVKVKPTHGEKMSRSQSPFPPRPPLPAPAVCRRLARGGFVSIFYASGTQLLSSRSVENKE